MKTPKEFVISEHSGIFMILFSFEEREQINALKDYCKSSRHILLYFEATNFQVVLMRVTDGVDFHKARNSAWQDFEEAGFSPVPDFNELYLSIIEIPDCYQHTAIYKEDAEYPF